MGKTRPNQEDMFSLDRICAGSRRVSKKRGKKVRMRVILTKKDSKKEKSQKSGLRGSIIIIGE